MYNIEMRNFVTTRENNEAINREMDIIQLTCYDIKEILLSLSCGSSLFGLVQPSHSFTELVIVVVCKSKLLNVANRHTIGVIVT